MKIFQIILGFILFIIVIIIMVSAFYPNMALYRFWVNSIIPWLLVD